MESRQHDRLEWECLTVARMRMIDDNGQDLYSDDQGGGEGIDEILRNFGGPISLPPASGGGYVPNDPLPGGPPADDPVISNRGPIPLPDIQPGRSGETPRERQEVKTNTTPAQATKRRPSEPTPMPGSSFTSGGGSSPSGAPSGNQATLRRPSEPTPAAASPAQPSIMPFQPLASPPPSAMAAPVESKPLGSPDVSRLSPGKSSYFGSMGGLKGGGLGVPLDPLSNQSSDPIDSLLSMLKNKRGL